MSSIKATLHNGNVVSKKYILNLIDKNKLDFDFIIGLGIEGNMLATRTSIIKNKDYTFLPYSYRYEDHSTHEKQLNFENDGKIKTVLIITDVVHDGRTIRKLIHKKRTEDNTAKFFEPVEKIFVVSFHSTFNILSFKSIMTRWAVLAPIPFTFCSSKLL